ncbi:MAG: mycothiol conjugate amidase Mca [Acidimicrobiales bacterium]
MPDTKFSLLSVHAHPDDESSKGAGSVAKYSDAGVHSVLACCTGGEEGDILNAAMDRPEIRQNMTEVRREELATAAKIIGYDKVHYLGYRDSGMEDSDANHHPDSFAKAPLEEAVGRFVAIIRTEQPDVIVTYSDDQQGYRHPDHLMVHDITVPAWHAAGDPNAYPDAGEPWTPLKLYYSTWSRARLEALHALYGEMDLESPYTSDWFTRPSTDDRVTTWVDVAQWYHRRNDALLAHATQVDPESPFWFGLPPERAAAAYPWDDYILAEARVPVSVPEADLFAGVPGWETI